MNFYRGSVESVTKTRILRCIISKKLPFQNCNKAMSVQHQNSHPSKYKHRLQLTNGSINTKEAWTLVATKVKIPISI